MKYFYDTEFHEDGSTIDLISIGIVAEDGREYYAVNSDMNHDRISTNDWLCRNVIPHLPLVDRTRQPSKSFGSSRWIWSLDTRSILVKPKWVIANEVREFLLAEPNPELWADFSAYDHVALAQLWGKMIQLPAGLPMYTRDFQQRLDDLGRPEIPDQVSGSHDALEDARHLKRCFRHVSEELLMSTAPDPGLTDLIAAHRLKQSYWNWWGCTGCDWRTKGTYSSEPTTETATEHAKHVVEQHTNGRIAELREWQIKVATALGMCEEVMGVGYSIANAKDASERAENLTTLELEHIECPVWCYECERMERWQSCTHCNGSGCGPGTASGAYEECEWCAGDGRDHEPDLTARAEKAEATNARVEAAVSGLPACDKYEPDDVISCGWKNAVVDVIAALEGEQR